MLEETPLEVAEIRTGRARMPSGGVLDACRTVFDYRRNLPDCCWPLHGWEAGGKMKITSITALAAVLGGDLLSAAGAAAAPSSARCKGMAGARWHVGR